MSPIKQSDGRNEEIEVLRAVAVLYVLLHHYEGLIVGHHAMYPYVEGLFSGVDLFFCISGYVIARSLIPKLIDKTGADFRREVGAFWIKRWYRIIPAAWLWIVALLLTLGLKALKGNSVVWYDTFSAIFQYTNFHFYRCTVDATQHCAVFQQYWSLSLEEQFYLLIPLAIFLFRKRLGYFVLALALSQMVMERNHWTGLSGFVRTDAIALGVLLAIISRQPVYRSLEPTALKARIGRIVPLLILGGIAIVPNMKPFPQYMGLLSLLCLVIVWLSSYGKGYIMGPSILRRWVVKIGERSFAIYLGQIVAFNIGRRISDALLSPDTPHVVTKILLTVAIGAITLSVLVEASYRFVEVPWRRRGRLIADRFSASLSSIESDPIDGDRKLATFRQES